MTNWLETNAFVNEVNAPESEYTHTAGHNMFSDWTRNEYKNFVGQPMDKAEFKNIELKAEVEASPSGQIDWR
jgi:hypothetical protein